MVELFSHLVLVDWVLVVIFSKAQADADGLVQEQQVIVNVPGVLIVFPLDLLGFRVVVRLVGSEFNEVSHLRRSSGSSLEPHDSRVVFEFGRIAVCLLTSVENEAEGGI